MEATQAIEGFVTESEEEDDAGQLGEVAVGSLTFENSEAQSLYLGMNIVSRDTGSGGEAQVEEWKREFRPSLVHGIFLNEASISTKHAALYLEDRGNFCFVKDLGSRNKSYMIRNGGETKLDVGDRYSIMSGDRLRFGALSCRVEYSQQAGLTVDNGRGGQLDTSYQATQVYGRAATDDAEAAAEATGAQSPVPSGPSAQEPARAGTASLASPQPSSPGAGDGMQPPLQNQLSPATDPRRGARRLSPLERAHGPTPDPSGQPGPPLIPPLIEDTQVLESASRGGPADLEATQLVGAHSYEPTEQLQPSLARHWDMEPTQLVGGGEAVAVQSGSERGLPGGAESAAAHLAPQGAQSGDTSEDDLEGGIVGGQSAQNREVIDDLLGIDPDDSVWEPNLSVSLPSVPMPHPDSGGNLPTASAHLGSPVGSLPLSLNLGDVTSPLRQAGPILAAPTPVRSPAAAAGGDGADGAAEAAADADGGRQDSAADSDATEATDDGLDQDDLMSPLLMHPRAATPVPTAAAAGAGEGAAPAPPSSSGWRAKKAHQLPLPGAGEAGGAEEQTGEHPAEHPTTAVPLPEAPQVASPPSSVAPLPAPRPAAPLPAWHTRGQPQMPFEQSQMPGSEEVAEVMNIVGDIAADFPATQIQQPQPDSEPALQATAGGRPGPTPPAAEISALEEEEGALSQASERRPPAARPQAPSRLGRAAAADEAPTPEAPAAGPEKGAKQGRMPAADSDTDAVTAEASAEESELAELQEGGMTMQEAELLAEEIAGLGPEAATEKAAAAAEVAEEEAGAEVPVVDAPPAVPKRGRKSAAVKAAAAAASAAPSSAPLEIEQRPEDSAAPEKPAPKRGRKSAAAVKATSAPESAPPQEPGLAVAAPEKPAKRGRKPAAGKASAAAAAPVVASAEDVEMTDAAAPETEPPPAALGKGTKRGRKPATKKVAAITPGVAEEEGGDGSGGGPTRGSSRLAAKRSRTRSASLEEADAEEEEEAEEAAPARGRGRPGRKSTAGAAGGAKADETGAKGAGGSKRRKRGQAAEEPLVSPAGQPKASFLSPGQDTQCAADALADMAEWTESPPRGSLDPRSPSPDFGPTAEGEPEAPQPQPQTAPAAGRRRGAKPEPMPEPPPAPATARGRAAASARAAAPVPDLSPDLPPARATTARGRAAAAAKVDPAPDPALEQPPPARAAPRGRAAAAATPTPPSAAQPPVGGRRRPSGRVEVLKAESAPERESTPEDGLPGGSEKAPKSSGLKSSGSVARSRRKLGSMTPDAAPAAAAAAESQPSGKAGEGSQPKRITACGRTSGSGLGRKPSLDPATVEAEAGPSGPSRPQSQAGLESQGAEQRKGRGQKRKGPEQAADASKSPDMKRALRKLEAREVRVLFSTCVDSAQRESYSRVVARLGGSIAADHDTDFTHFVTLQAQRGEKDRGFKKSLNSLVALAAGRPIVAETWVEASGRSGAFVDPRGHLLNDEAAQKQFGFNMATSYDRAQRRLLLQDLNVFLTPGLVGGEADKGVGVRRLVELAGGTLAKALPKGLSGEDQAQLAHWVIIGSEKDVPKERSWCAGKLKPGVPVHSRAFLVDSIMQQSLDLSAGVLFTT